MTYSSKAHQELSKEIASLKERIHQLQADPARKEMEVAPWGSDNWLATIIRGTHALLMSVDINGCFTYVNDATARAIGYTSPREIVGKSYLHFIHPDDRQRVLETYTSQVNARQPSCMQEFRIIDTEGHIKWLSFLSSLTIKNGEIVGQSGVAQDISERKRAEEHLHLLAQVSAASSDYIVLIGSDYRYRFANDIYLQARQLRREDILGRHMIDIVGHEKFAELGRPQVAAALRGESVYSLEWTDFGKNDHHYLHVRVTPFREVDGTITGVVMTGRDITEVKSAEQALEQEHNLYKDLVASQPSGVYRLRIKAQRPWGESEWVGKIESNYKLEMVSDLFCEILGVTREQCEGNFSIVVETIHPEDRSDFVTRNVQVLKSLEPFSWEGRLKVRDEVSWVYFASVPRCLNDGDVIWTGILLDITEHKQAEQQLQRQTILFQNLFKSSPEAIAVLDHEDRVQEINRSFETLFGYSQAEAQGRGINDLLAPEPYRGEAQSVSEMVIGEGRLVEKEAIRCAKGGRPVDVSLIGYPLVVNQQKIGAYAIYRDISERKRSVKQLSRAHQTLLSILDGIDATVYVADMDSYEILFMNKYIIDAFGGNFTGRRCYQVFRGLSHPCDHCTNDRLLDAQGQPTGGSVWESRNPITKKWYINYDRVIRWHDGRIVKLQIATDITERKQAEEEKGKLQLQLTQAHKMESVGRLAGGVAHDFNNMLGVILGHAELALMKTGPDEPLHSNLEEIRKAAERSAELTRQLLAFARKQTVAPKVLDLNETIESALKMLRRLIGEDIDLAWLPGRNLEPIYIDASQVDQILTNLCVNARDAIVGTGKVTIETGNVVLDEEYCARHAGFIPGKFVLLAVSDSGCGMDAEMLSHIFEPFFTTKEMGKGTGLGLATVYGAVKQNNGFINVKSEPGKGGTTFKIYLPRHAAKATPRIERQQEPTPTGGGETILLVEDEPAILEITTVMLQEMGYAVIAVGTPGEAIRLVQGYKGQIDLLITDVVMPQMNGRDLASNLMSIFPSIKRLFMSGYTADVIAHHGVLDQGVHFIPKPFSMKDLGRKLREVLEG